MAEPSEAFELVRVIVVKQVVEHRKSLAEAARFAVSMGLDRVLVSDVVRHLDELRKNNYPVEDVVDDSANRHEWYLGPQSDDRWWEFYKATLIASGKRWMIPTLDVNSTEITALLSDPAAIDRKRKGLVVGNVQSGKTANYTAVMAKAADAGCRFVIVLAGMHNNLRRQTQLRLENDLLRDDWVRLTDGQEDFGNIIDGTALFNNTSVRMAAVVKKNATRLENLYHWFESVPEAARRMCPVLIIDDEADQATPNTLAEKNEVSSINKWLRKLWDITPTGTYVAYTATPFANVFMDPGDDSDLFPSDFIINLPVGEGYFGAARVFGTAAVNDDPESPPELGLDMVRAIPDTDAAVLKPPTNAEQRQSFDPELPTSLTDAIHWFVVATAIRRARGQSDHSSMLVHTTHYALPHERMKNRILDYTSRVLMPAVNADDLALFEMVWKDEAHRVAWSGADKVDWQLVRTWVPGVLGDLEVKVDNGVSDDRLDYTAKGPDGKVVLRTVIAVGGGTLSRGLTLEGLVVSYFTRSTSTYDTLLQMGRWFGYRPGYEDLPRIWVSNNLDEDYAFLSRVEQDLRDEIRSFEGTDATPAQVGVRIRSHPGRLEITAKNKMFHAKKVQVTLSGVLRQTFLLDGSDPGVANSNVSALEALIGGGGLKPLAGGPRTTNDQRRIRRDVSAGAVQKFLADYAFCTDHDEVVEQNLMINWIMNSAPAALWNVVVVGRGTPLALASGGAAEAFKIGGYEFNSVNRAPLGGGKSTKERLNFKAVVSPSDRIADLDPTFKGSVAEMMRHRRLHGGGKGLILAYPISRHSVPTASASASGPQPKKFFRVPLSDFGVEHDLLGLGILFPAVSAAAGSEGEFYSVRADWEIDDSYDEELPQDTEASSSVARRPSA